MPAAQSLTRPLRVHRTHVWAGLGWLVAACLAGLFAGFIVGLDTKVPAVLLLGLISATALLTISSSAALWVMLVFALVVTGTVQYFGRINQIQWLPSLLAAVMSLRAVIELVSNRPRANLAVSAGKLPIPAFIWIFAAYVFIALAANLGKPTSAIQFLAGVKNYLAIWGILLLMTVARISPEGLAKVWKGLIVIAFFQLPMVVYQHFFVASKRATEFALYHRPAWDSVVGTFGGDPDGGGASGALALFLVVALTLLLALWKNGLLKLSKLIVGSAVIILAIGLAEVKVVLVLVPLAVLLLFRRDLLRRPHLLAGASLLVAMLLAAMAMVYQALYWDEGSGRNISVVDNVNRAFENTIDPDNLNPITGEIGRVATLALWARDSRSGFNEKILGHGFGASRISPVGIGDIARRYFPYRIGTTGAASMLWDIGVLGLFAFSAILLSAVVTARRLSRNPAIPPFHRSVLEAAVVSIALVYLTVYYNADVLFLPAIGVLLMLLLGQVAYWQLRVGAEMFVPSDHDMLNGPKDLGAPPIAIR